MTKKHFIALAEELRRERPATNWSASKHIQWDMDVKAIALVCKRFNPAFNRDRFIAACGGLFTP